MLPARPSNESVNMTILASCPSPDDPKWIERRRDCWLRRAKRLFLSLLIEGVAVSTDDVRQQIPLPDGISPCLVGDIPAEFHRDGLIERAGDFRTERPIAHRRYLSLRRIKDIDAARDWLASHPDLTGPGVAS